ncbi:MAG: prepilin-type N-terminal cleavage/methylation domain-containing protein [Pirellulaceae bacterium]
MLVVTHSETRRRRLGLTLIELVVVLSVLAAVAAILVPLIPNLLRRSHKVTDATQTAEVSKAVLTYQGLYQSYPDEWDLMTDGTSTTAPSFIPADGGTPFGGAAYIGNLTTDEVAALRRVGISNVHAFSTTPAHPTLNPYAASVTLPTALSNSLPVFIIDSSITGGVPVEIQNILARDNTARFVVFGLGSRCTAVSRVMQNAPTSVPQNAEFTPSTLYSRVGTIFQVAGTGINTTERARFIGAVALEDDELESAEKDLVNYYDISASGE